MCESNAYLTRNGEEELILESVSFVKSLEDSVVLRSLFGEEVTVRGRLRELDLTGHKIVVEPTT